MLLRNSLKARIAPANAENTNFEAHTVNTIPEMNKIPLIKGFNLWENGSSVFCCIICPGFSFGTCFIIAEINSDQNYLGMIIKARNKIVVCYNKCLNGL